MAQINQQKCSQDTDCDYLYNCVEQLCYHKNLFPPEKQEFIGVIVMIILSGISALAGIGGGAQLVTVLVQFFNYPQKESILLVFIPIFGGASGNFANLIQQRDTTTNKPIVNMKLAILACPMMAFGSIVGVVLNKFFPEFWLIVILDYFLYQSFKKFIKLAKIDYQTESRRIVESTKKEFQLKEIELELIDNHRANNQTQQIVSQNQKDDINQTIFAIMIILMTFLALFFIRGSRDVKSLLKIEYCGKLYWMVTALIALVCFIFFKHTVTCGHVNITQYYWQQAKSGVAIYNSQSLIETFILKQSFKAGIMSGFGMGGGMFLVPMYTSLGLSSIQATGTSSFNIFMTSFLTMVQVISLGMMPIQNALQILILNSLGTYFSSKLIFTSLRYFDRLSYIMYALVAFSLVAMITLPLQFVQGQAQNGLQISEIYNFSEFC